MKLNMLLLTAVVLAFVGQAIMYSLSRSSGDYFTLLAAFIIGLVAAVTVSRLLNIMLLIQVLFSAAAAFLMSSTYWFYVIWLRRDIFSLMHEKDVGLLYGLYQYAVVWHSVLWSILLLFGLRLFRSHE